MSKSNYSVESQKGIGAGNGISVSEQFPAESIATVTLDDRPPTEVWGDIATSDAFIDALVRSLRSYANGMYVDEFREEMRSYDLPGAFDALAVGLADRSYSALRDFIGYIEGLGTFEHTTTEHVHAAAELLRLGEGTAPTVAVRLTKAFEGRRRDQRNDLLKLVFTLADGADVRLVLEESGREFLWRRHRSKLPECVESECRPSRHASPSDADRTAKLRAAEEEIADSKKLQRIIELVGDAEAEWLSYARLANALSISRETVRTHAMRLAGVDLTYRVSRDGSKSLELTPLGHDYYKTIVADREDQTKFDDFVESTRKPSDNTRVNPPLGRGEGTPDRPRMGDGKGVHGEYLPRHRYAALTGCSIDGGIALVEQPEAGSDDRREHYTWYDADADRLAVGAEYDTCMQYWLCIARALTNEHTFRNAITAERLDGENGGLSALLESVDINLLRRARCIGFLKDSDASGEAFLNRLRDEHEHLLALTSKLHNGDYEDRKALRGTITSRAHGLVGTVIHVCDLLGIEVVREMRLINFLQNTSPDDRAELVKTIGMGVAIQSAIGHCSVYRQRYESRPEKRETAITADVTHATARGRFIGSLVITGNGVSRIESDLREAIRDEVADYEPHDDAPDFEVGVPIKTFIGRQSFGTAISEVLAAKNLSATDESIAIMQALTDTPFDAAKALYHGLRPEERYPGRDIRIDELRTALVHFGDDHPGRILPDAPPTVSKMVHALLATEGSLTQAELAEKAGITSASVNNNRDILEALGLISVSKNGRTYAYRLNISYKHERGSDAVVPTPVSDTLMNAKDLLTEAMEGLYGSAIDEPGHPIGEALASTWPPDALADADPSLEPWVEVAIALTGSDEPEHFPETFGKEPEQAALPTEVSA